MWFCATYATSGSAASRRAAVSLMVPAKPCSAATYLRSTLAAALLAAVLVRALRPWVFTAESLNTTMSPEAAGGDAVAAAGDAVAVATASAPAAAIPRPASRRAESRRRCLIAELPLRAGHSAGRERGRR